MLFVCDVWHLQNALQDISRDTFCTELHALTRYNTLTCGVYNNVMQFHMVTDSVTQTSLTCGTKPALIYPYMEKLSLFHALHHYKV